MKLAILEANIVNEQMKCRHVSAKLGKLSQHLSIESYANEFQNLCARIVTLPMSVGDKIQQFIDGLKSELKLKVAVDPLNDAQPWEDFQSLVTYVIYVDSNL